ncbi:MAG: hypothetical protein L6Q98_19815 [Anaerolineae bacterium]|nr:hypothetical protein [Anaerolineae bacterium]
MPNERNHGGRAHFDTSQDAQIATRRKIVGANLLAGVDYRTMAGSLGVSLGTVAKDVQALMTEWREERIRTIDEFKQLHLTRLDVLLNGLWDKARQGDSAAIDKVLAVMDRQARIMGIDVVRVAGTVGRMSDDDARRILAGAASLFGSAGESDLLQDAAVEGLPPRDAPGAD